MIIMGRKSLEFNILIPFCFSFLLDYADKSVIIKELTTAFWLAVAYVGESG